MADATPTQDIIAQPQQLVPVFGLVWKKGVINRYFTGKHAVVVHIGFRAAEQTDQAQDNG